MTSLASFAMSIISGYINFGPRKKKYGIRVSLLGTIDSETAIGACPWGKIRRSERLVPVVLGVLDWM
jgi:hypothetical protein